MFAAQRCGATFYVAAQVIAVTGATTRKTERMLRLSTFPATENP
jgi:hypothetical protein